MKLIKGQKVEIWDSCKENLLGIGRYLGSVKIYVGTYIVGVPKFRLGRKVIYGYECWWITVSEANKLKRQFSNPAAKTREQK